MLKKLRNIFKSLVSKPHQGISPRWALTLLLLTGFCLAASVAHAVPTVTPSSLSLRGLPGQMVSADFTVTGTDPPFTFQVFGAGGTVSPSILDVSGGTATYSFTIPSTATAGQQFLATIDVANSLTPSPGITSVPVTITVTAPLAVSPTRLDLSGIPGQTLNGTVTISGGTSPYNVSITSNTMSVNPASTTTTGTLNCSFTIPQNATPGQVLTATIDVADLSASPQRATVPVNVRVQAPPIVTNPASLFMNGRPGQTLTGHVDISGGTAPYNVTITSSTMSVSPASTTTQGPLDANFTVPQNATPGQKLTATITVTDASRPQQTNTVPVEVTVVAPPTTLTVNPASFSLSGQAGQTVRGTLAISGGTSPYNVTITSSTMSVSPASTTTQGSVDCSFTIPQNASAGQILTATIRVTDAGDPQQSKTVPVQVTVQGNTVTTNVTKFNLTTLSGTSVNGTLVISGGTPPYTVTTASSRLIVSPASTETDGTVTLKFTVPPKAKPGEKLTATITITDKSNPPQRITVPVEVVVAAAPTPLSGIPGLSPGQKGVGRTIEEICPELFNLPSRTPGQEQLLQRCTQMLVNANNHPAATKALQQVTPDKNIAAGAISTRTETQRLGAVTGRLVALRAGATGINVSGLPSSTSPDSQGTALAGLPGGPSPANTADTSTSETALASLRGDSGVILKEKRFNLADASLSKSLFGSSPGDTGGAASADTSGLLGKGLGVFLNGNFAFGDHDRTLNESGYDYNVNGLTAGIDYRFTKDLILGLAFTYANTDIDMNLNGGNLGANGYSFTLYGNYNVLQDLYIEMTASYGWSDFDSRRNIAYSIGTDNINTANQANYSGDQYSFSIGAGYDFHFDALTLGLAARMNYFNLDIDSYHETDVRRLGLDMDFADQSTDSLTTTLGTYVNYAVSTSVGVFVPKLRIEWEHEFKDDSRLIQGNFTNDPFHVSPTPFFIPNDNPDRDYFRISPGLSMQFAHGISGLVNYQALVGYDNFTQHTFTVGLRYEF